MIKEYNVTVNGTLYEVTVESVTGKKAPTYAPATCPAAPAPALAPATAPAAKPAAPKADGSVHTITSPMPGTILDIKCGVGQTVKANDVLFVLEAMKMENEIFAGVDGTVFSVAVTKGASVNPGEVLCVIR